MVVGGAKGDLTDAVIGQGPAQQEERSPETVTSGGGFTDGRVKAQVVSGTHRCLGALTETSGWMQELDLIKLL